jgi:hypothetical protein
VTSYQIEKACRGERDILRDPKKVTKKKDSRKKWVREADKWASLDIRLDEHCVLTEFVPGHVCKGSIVCGHLFSRVAYTTRWDEANLYPICSWTNIRMEDDPVVARQLLEYAEASWGSDKIAELHQSYERARPIPTSEIKEAAEIWHAKYIKHYAWRGK